MPTYAYRCDCCGESFDIVQPIADHPLADCPTCSEGDAPRAIGTLRRVYTGGRVGVRFRGTGFYSTDKKRG